MARRLLAACLLGMLVLSGCGGSAAEEPRKTTSPSPTKTTPAVPVVPEAAKANTREGADAFVRHWVEAINQAQLDGEIAPLREAMTPGCKTCRSVIEKLDALRQADATVVGGEWTVTHVELRDADGQVATTGPVTAAIVDIKSTKQTITQPGKDVETYPAGPARHLLALDWSQGSWKVSAWTVV